jgi:hypothetical protein
MAWQKDESVTGYRLSRQTDTDEDEAGVDQQLGRAGSETILPADGTRAEEDGP